ncbi:hypothetical protein [Neobacillus sp. 19]|uniref:hypothetical protein n=1 Tax=Neobacillus sp. 19 TaxID=3394458 RepID=UPI003BF74FEA
MQAIIWAISSMAALMLIISFLPLGYTLKGKFLVVFVSFILSLGGLAAASTFPMWQTALMLFGLIFFTSYFMNNRMDTLIVKEGPVCDDLLEKPFDYQKVESHTVDNLLKLEEEFALSDSAYINIEKESVSENGSSSLSANLELRDNNPETINEDVSFLLERNTEVEVIEHLDDKGLNNDYLSDIESLLELEAEKELDKVVDREPVSLQK